MTADIPAKKPLKKGYRIRESRGDQVFDVVVTILLLALALVALYPLYYTIIASVSDPQFVSTGKVVLLPHGLTTIAYKEMFKETQIWIGYRNSLFYTITYTFLSLVVTLPTAYVLSRPTLPGQKGLLFYFMFTMYFSGGTVPLYLLMTKLHLVNTIWIMIIPEGVACTNLIICRNYFTSNIPESLYESARIDGASLFQFFMRFVIPLSKPIISVISLYFAIGKWNNYLQPMIYIRDNKIQSLQVIIRSITAELDSGMVESMSADEVDELTKKKQLLKFAVVIITALPLMLLYPFIQRYLISGMMVGAVKE